MMTTIDRIAAWMQEVMDRNNWSAEEWARAAATSPTNITRFLSKRDYVPSGRVLDELANAARSRPPLGPESATVTEIPLLQESEMGEILTRRFSTTANVSRDSFAVRLETDTMSLGGIIPGDMMVIEPERTLPRRHGAVMAFRSGGKTYAARYFPPYMMPQSTNPAHSPIRESDVEVLGTVVQIIRDLR